jgi:hypothetical protein
LTPVSSAVLPVISAPYGVGASQYHSLGDGAQYGAALASPSSRVELSGTSRLLSALSDLRVATGNLHENAAASTMREGVARFVQAMQLFTRTLAISAIDDTTEADSLQMPGSAEIGNALLQNMRAPYPSADLTSIGMRINMNSGNINIDSAQFSSALTRDPLRTIGLLSQTTDRLDALLASGLRGAGLSMNSITPRSTNHAVVENFGAAATIAAAPIPLQTAQAIRSFLDVAAL